MTAATASLCVWHAIEIFFFFNVYSKIDVFLHTASLSMNIFFGLFNDTPKILNLCLRDSITSIETLKAMNSGPNELTSTVARLFLKKTVGALLIKSNTPL